MRRLLVVPFSLCVQWKITASRLTRSGKTTYDEDLMERRSMTSIREGD